MRIRNSRPPFPFPSLTPQIVSRSSRFRSRGCAHFDDRFSVEEASRRIGWSSFLLRKPLKLDLEKAQIQDELPLSIPSESKSSNHVEQKNAEQNCMLKLRSHVSQATEEPCIEERKLNLSGNYESKEADRSKFSFPPVVLALPSTLSRPDRELPLKKRRFRGQFRFERNEARKDFQNVIEEVKIETEKMPEKEVSIRCDDGLTGGRINCVLNRESSLPSPLIYSPPGQEKPVQMVSQKATAGPGRKRKRRRGRPRRKLINNE